MSDNIANIGVVAICHFGPPHIDRFLCPRRRTRGGHLLPHQVEVSTHSYRPFANFFYAETISPNSGRMMEDRALVKLHGPLRGEAGRQRHRVELSGGAEEADFEAVAGGQSECRASLGAWDFVKQQHPFARDGGGSCLLRLICPPAPVPVPVLALQSVR